MTSLPQDRRKLLLGLAGGFAVLILLLVAVGISGLHSVQSVHENASRLSEEQLTATRLVDRIQRSQLTIRLVMDRLRRDPSSEQREAILELLARTDREIRSAADSAASTTEADLWKRLEEANRAFSTEVRRLLSVERASAESTGELFAAQDRVSAAVRKLVASSHQKALDANTQIEARALAYQREARLLLVLCAACGVVCAFVMVRFVGTMMRGAEEQADQLARLSWQLLEKQEATARRFAHELHDELGQSLAAVKANLTAIQANGRNSADRITDCMHSVDEAMANTREMSQLLRPAILDDFGLDTALRWLIERLTQRTGIDVDYEFNLEGEISDEARTHLFRIAQEALTNIARHSAAKHASVRLSNRNGRVHLAIADDGGGLPQPFDNQGAGFGFSGMRARAQSLGGSFAYRSKPNKGLTIEVAVPAGVPK